MVDEFALSMAPNASLARAAGCAPAWRNRMRALGAVGAATLMLHAALLSGLEWAWPGPPAAWRSVPLQVRVVAAEVEAKAKPVGNADERAASIDAAATSDQASASMNLDPAVEAASARAPRRAAPTPRETDAQGHSERQLPSPPSSPRSPAPAPTQVPAQGQAKVQVQAQPQIQIQIQTQTQTQTQPQDQAQANDQDQTQPPPQAQALSATPETTVLIEAPIPLYRTRIPPAATLRYVMSRGALRAEAEMQWRPAAQGYTLQLVGSGARPMIQSSRGEFDAAGLAPLRYTDERAGRSARSVLAANFQRELGKISFSASTVELPWVAGSQDRLSWMIQLAAVLAAEPERRTAGARLALPVVGVRGDAGMWIFRSLGGETLNLDAEPLSTLKLVRDSAALYEPEVTVWVDPARHFLPVRVLQSTGNAAQTLELVLRDLVIAP